MNYEKYEQMAYDLRKKRTMNKKCTGCFKDTLKEENAMNALSRYGHGYICSDCGTREAMTGDFIKANTRSNVLNTVTCGDCGTVFAHKKGWEGDLRCPYCGMKDDQCHFPDLYTDEALNTLHV